ncbi:ABC transporter permease DevC [Calothrix sp. PCC 6303]|uniref:ABC transporter permease DevC n=1 Tax=Calothrix sp. PCC 6303 TaxID=1170562 RepID=UPI0002A04A6C|nr:ABC transporter permease DevC [Calothrix sp. PCC 6303]AFZ02805.1 DevC protein [Calothrix sp. PCC 6303]
MPPKIFKKTPLAWRQLMKEKTRLLVAVAGIAFADILMLLQMGFESALYDASILPHRQLNADLVLIDPYMQTLFAVKSFPRERLYQTLASEGVVSTTPVYIASGQWRNPETRLERTILVWGVDPLLKTFKMPEVNQNLGQIKQLNTVLFDIAGRPDYGVTKENFLTFETELNSKSVNVEGLFINGASFAADGNIITSDSTFLNLFADRKSEKIELGLINLQPGSDVKRIQKQLIANLPKDVSVLTTEEFAQIEKTYWANSTAIGFIFGIGVGVGFIVGIVIVYQILYSDVSDHLPEYATLKAMGYTDGYLFGVLMQEALLLAVLGYIPSFFVVSGLYVLAANATMLPIVMTAERAVTVFVMTIVMCSISGFVAMGKLRSADPADIF